MFDNNESFENNFLKNVQTELKKLEEAKQEEKELGKAKEEIISNFLDTVEKYKKKYSEVYKRLQKEHGENFKINDYVRIDDNMDLKKFGASFLYYNPETNKMCIEYDKYAKMELSDDISKENFNHILDKFEIKVNKNAANSEEKYICYCTSEVYGFYSATWNTTVENFINQLEAPSGLEKAFANKILEISKQEQNKGHETGLGI